MTRSQRFIRTVAFVLCTTVAAGMLDAFGARAMSSLDPAAQYAIGLIASPLLFAPANPVPAHVEQQSPGS